MAILERRIGDILITAAGQTFKGKFELDKTVKLIKGINLTSDYENLMYYRGTQRIVINGREWFEENYESKNLQSTINVNVNTRMKDMDNLEPGNGIIEVDYTDTEHPLSPFTNYRVTLNVKYEI